MRKKLGDLNTGDRFTIRVLRAGKLIELTGSVP
jgi:hypothetical protein